MNEYAIYIISAVCLMQVNPRRFLVGMGFMIPILVHYAFFNDLNSKWYYITAIAANFIIIELIYRAQSNTRLALELTVFAFVSALLNVIGLVMWYQYMEPFAYNLLFTIIYLFELAALIKGEPGHDRDTTLDIWRSSFYTFGHSRISHY